MSGLRRILLPARAGPSRSRGAFSRLPGLLCSARPWIQSHCSARQRAAGRQHQLLLGRQQAGRGLPPARAGFPAAIRPGRPSRRTGLLRAAGWVLLERRQLQLDARLSQTLRGRPPCSPPDEPQQMWGWEGGSAFLELSLSASYLTGFKYCSYLHHSHCGSYVTAEPLQASIFSSEKREPQAFRAGRCEAGSSQALETSGAASLTPCPSPRHPSHTHTQDQRPAAKWQLMRAGVRRPYTPTKSLNWSDIRNQKRRH